MEWFIYALLAPALWALNNIFIKFLITNKFRTYVPMISTLTFMDLLFVISTLAIVPFTFNFPYTIYALMVGLMPVIAFWFYSKALLIEEVSRIITLFQLIPLFVTLFSVIFLNEILGFEKYLGIAIIVSASLLISSKKIEGKYSFSGVFKYIIPFGLIIATYTIIEKWLLNY